MMTDIRAIEAPNGKFRRSLKTMEHFLRHLTLRVALAGSALVASGCALDRLNDATTGTCDPGDACVCTGSGGCERTCSGKGCDLTCAGSGACTFHCPEGGCGVVATANGATILDCKGGGCTLECKGNGACSVTNCPTCPCEKKGTGTCTHTAVR